MPTAMTFDSLMIDLGKYSQRAQSAASDPNTYAQLPKLINLAERRICNDLQIQGFITPVNSAMTTGVAVYAKPDRWRATASLNFGNGTNNNVRNPVYPRVYELLRAFWPDDSLTGTPRYYADYDYQHFIVAPTPDQNYPFELVCYQLPPMLDASNQQNWVTEYLPSALLYGALKELALFVKNQADAGGFDAEYNGFIQKVGTSDLKKIIDRTSTRNAA